MDKLRLGRILLIPGALIFAFRAIVQLATFDLDAIPLLGPITGITGALSAVGMILIMWGAWKTSFQGQAILAFLATGLGHYVLAPHSQDAGAAFVYLGLGLSTPAAIGGGIAAAIGALMRADHPVAHAAVVGGLIVVVLAILEVGKPKHE